MPSSVRFEVEGQKIHVHFPYDRETVEMIRSIPGRKWLPDGKCWTVPDSEVNRRARVFSQEDIEKIAQTYHNWRNPNGDYENVKGFCNSASIERVRELDYVLTPGRYVGLPEEEDDFEERFTQLKAEFEEQLKEEARLNALIAENLQKVKLE